MRGRVVDLTGQRFGRYVALRYLGELHTNRYYWLCRCDCGSELPVLGLSLRSGNSRGCSRCKHRVVLAGRMFCSRGHEFTPANTTPEGRCKTCRHEENFRYHNFGIAKSRIVAQARASTNQGTTTNG